MEFFSNFDYIKSKYDFGYVVATELYKLVKEEKNITMSYKQFSIYFREYLFKKDERFFSSAVKNKIEPDEIIAAAPAKIANSKIKKIVSGDPAKKKYNPHTREINEADRI